MKKFWAKSRNLSWFIANSTTWLYEYAEKKCVEAKQKLQFVLAAQGSEAFKRAFVIHRITVATGVKRTLKTINYD